jgi:hypothetical protein
MILRYSVKMSADKRTYLVRQRVPDLTAKLLEVERKLYGGSESDALERLVLRGSQHPDALAILLEETQKDPKQAIVLSALKSLSPRDEPGLKQRKGGR